MAWCVFALLVNDLAKLLRRQTTRTAWIGCVWTEGCRWSVCAPGWKMMASGTYHMWGVVASQELRASD